MKRLAVFLCMAILIWFSSPVFAIPVGVFGDIDYWVTDASRLSGTGGEYAGVDPIAGLVGDDLTDGAINLGLFTTDSFLLEFSYGIINTVGDDFIVFDGRFSSDGINFEININDINVPETDFVYSGLDFTLKNTALGFELFGAPLDLSDWGIAEGEVIYSMTMISYAGTDNQADIMGVGVFSPSTVPEPATMLLLGSGLLGLAGFRRRFRK